MYLVGTLGRPVEYLLAVLVGSWAGYIFLQVLNLLVGVRKGLNAESFGGSLARSC